MPNRDLKREEEAVGLFHQRYGREPNLQNPDERSEVYNQAYADIGLPEELRGTVEESQNAAGISTPDVPSVQSDYADTSRLDSLQQEMQGASQDFQQMAHPNEALRIFQSALRKKTGVGDKRMGESEVFKEAGLTGMGALQSSLAARQQEIDMNQTEFNNLVGQVGGIFKDQMLSAQYNYDLIKDMYNNELDRINKIDNMAREHEMQKDLVKMEHDLSLEKARIEAELESEGSSLAGLGYEHMRNTAQQNLHLSPSALEDKMRNERAKYDLDISDGDINAIIKNRYNQDMHDFSETPQGQFQALQEEEAKAQVGTPSESVYGNIKDPYAELKRKQIEETFGPPSTEFERLTDFVRERINVGSNTLDQDIREYQERRGVDFSEKELDEAFNTAQEGYTPDKFYEMTKDRLSSLKENLESTGTGETRKVTPEELLDVWTRQEKGMKNGFLKGDQKLEDLPKYQQIELLRTINDIYDGSYKKGDFDLEYGSKDVVKEGEEDNSFWGWVKKIRDVSPYFYQAITPGQFPGLIYTAYGDLTK